MSTTFAPATDNGRATRRDWLALGVLSLAVLLIAVDATVLDLAVPAISADLAPSSTELLWIIDVYSFVLAGLLITMGTLGDRIGRRRLLLIGAAGFGLASAVAAWSVDPAMLIAARVLQGISGATLMPATLGLIRSIFRDPMQRTTAVGVWAAMAGGGAAAGPLIGGWLLEHYWWGSVFLVNVPVMVALIVFGRLVVPEFKDPAPGRFDLISAAASIVAVVPIVYALKEIAVHGVTTERVVVGIVGALVAVYFVGRQRRLAQPMLDLSLFGSPRFSTAVVTNLMAVFALAGVLFFGSQYLQLVVGASPLEAGLLMLPGTLGTVVTSLLAARLVARWGTRNTLAAGLFATAAGAALLVLLPASGDARLFVAGFAILGAGVGVALTLPSAIVVSAVAPERAGAASAISESAYELGVALGVALIGSVVMRIFRGDLDVSALSATDAVHATDTLGGAVTIAHTLSGEAGQALLDSAHLAFVGGVHVAAAVTAVLLTINALLVLRLLRDR